MKEIVWKLSNKLNDRTQIVKLEEVIGKSLPPDYVNCVSENNRGRPSRHAFETPKGVRVFNNLLSLHEDENENIFKIYQYISEETERADILPFARDPFGNYICFDFSKDPASIVFWDHEVRTIEAVCKSFTDLVNMLHDAE